MPGKNKASSSSIEQYAEKEDQISQPLTKNAHRNPDIHQRGDTLPESLLEYQEGSATLNPDVAGNTPVMLRSTQEVLGNGVNQNLTGSITQLGNLSILVSCPPQATGSPFIIASFATSFIANPTGGGADTYGWMELDDGVVVPGSRCYRWAQNLPGSDFVPVSSRRKISISPGQVKNIRVRAQQLVPAGFEIQYVAGMGSDATFLMTELYY